MNKKTKKRIIGLALVFALFAVIASGTLAYFTDETEVATNAFTVGKVQIRLSETLVDADGVALDTVAKPDAQTAYKNHTAADANGEVWDAAGETLVETRTDVGNNADNEKATKVKGYDGNDYGYALMPGKTVDKDPVVTVLKGSEESYVRVKVSLDHAANFIKVYRDHNGNATIEEAIAAMTEYFVGYDPAVWVYADGVVEDDVCTVTFNYKETVKKNTEANTNLEPVITAVTLPSWVTSEDAALFETKENGEVTAIGFNVDVIAQAIQAAGFDDAEAAWKAFDGQMNPEPQE